MENRELIDLTQENELVPSGIKKGKIHLNVGQSRMRATYYRQDKNGDWGQTAPLPADPASVSQYFAKGFRAKPPQVIPKEVEVEQAKPEGTVSCPFCEFETQSAFGLQAHLRKHINKKKEDKI